MIKGQILCVSGASTKLPAIYGATVALYEKQGIDPEILAGVSSGAITVLFASVKKFAPEIRQTIVNATVSDFFKVSPVTPKGKINVLTVLKRLLTGKHSLGDQSNLKKLLKKHFTQADHEELKASKRRVYVGAVSFNTGEIEYLPVHELEYNEAINAVYASTCIPIYTEGQEINGELFYDGGLIDHIPSATFAVKGVNEIISVYSRPEDGYVTRKETKEVKKNVGTIFTRMIDIMTYNVSREDEKMTDALCKQHNIDHKKIFMPYKLTERTYVSGRELTRAWYEIGFNATLEAYGA